MKSRVTAPAVAVVLALLAAGCGGGDSSPEPAPPPPPPDGTPIASNSCEAFTTVTGSVTGNLASKASSPAGRSLSFSSVSQPQSGTVSLTSTGGFTYTPSGHGQGKLDSFVYRVTDSTGLAAEATAQVIYGRTRIMPLGDSITDGVETYTGADGPAMNVRVGYRKKLYDRLTQEGYAVEFVGSANAGSAAGLAFPKHEGHSGFTQGQLVAGIDGWLAQNAPDVVLLHIGTNDVNQGSISAAETSTLLGSIDSWSAATTSPPVQLLLAKIIQQRPDAPNDDDVPAFNADLTSKYNSNWATPKPKFKVNLVDMYSKLVPATDLSLAGQDSSGLHPNSIGYGKMADAWYEYLVENNAVTKCQ